jgi:hypothetical protein
MLKKIAVALVAASVFAAPVLMLWTAPPRARECHGSGCC